MIVNFSCPNCGADMSYDIKLGKLHCDHCDHSEDIQPAGESYKNAAGEPADKPRYCVNCGGLLSAGAKTCATHCEYCGAPLVMADRLSGEWRPAYVLPFELDREKAEAAFRKWCHNGRFSPKGFMAAKNIQRLQPLYIPYWLYDVDTNVDVRGTATRVNIYVRGETEYTETDFFDVRRKMRLEYTKVPHDASEKMDDTLMAKLEPYRFDTLRTFQIPYLAGFEADQGDYRSEDLLSEVKQQVAGYAAEYARSTISGYTSVHIDHQQMDYENISSGLCCIDGDWRAVVMKKVLNFLMVLLMVMGLGMASGMTAFQAEAAETSGETALAANQDGDKGADAKKAASGIYDEANLLSEDEEASLMTQLEKYSSKYSADIAIVTTNDAGGMSSQAYADAYAEKIGQSMSGDEYPGILFLIDMDNRQIYMATQGRAMNYYDDYRISKVLDNCYNHITDGDYKGTCEAFLKGVRDYMGRSTSKSARMDAFGVLIRLLIAMAIGAVATFAMVFRRGGHVTTNSRTYFDASASHLDAKEDRFMNRTVTRRQIEKPKGGGGGHGGSGGGGIHTSSGGGTHGGGGRSF